VSRDSDVQLSANYHSRLIDGELSKRIIVIAGCTKFCWSHITFENGAKYFYLTSVEWGNLLFVQVILWESRPLNQQQIFMEFVRSTLLSVFSPFHQISISLVDPISRGSLRLGCHVP
jgi:hypothetical protein